MELRYITQTGCFETDLFLVIERATGFLLAIGGGGGPNELQPLSLGFAVSCHDDGGPGKSTCSDLATCCEATFLPRQRRHLIS
jgi:hypothetical protein